MMKRLTPLAFALLVLGGLLTGALAGTSPAAEENASEASDPLETEGESAEPGSDVFMTLPEVFVYAQKMQQDIRKVPQASSTTALRKSPTRASRTWPMSSPARPAFPN